MEIINIGRLRAVRMPVAATWNELRIEMPWKELDADTLRGCGRSLQ